MSTNYHNPNIKLVFFQNYILILFQKLNSLNSEYLFFFI